MTSLLERLPRIYEECGELQERIEEETLRRQALEQQLVHFTQDQVRSNLLSTPFSNCIYVYSVRCFLVNYIK